MQSIRKQNVFPTDDPVKMVVWLAIQAALQKWTMSLRDSISRFIIGFADRLDAQL
ncbi:hypothetical protein KB20921_29350 [Edwardsiella ictaluri]|nr:Uncharacterised protein [Edwardsiella ictaluri]BEI00197.1 hypothetical protein KH20906_29240 [Edwardsiella ictaluri]BEI03674.1 hypothetical protein KB20921_29350 [Edwardsiella ictaluri]BEI07131.1 hypothetical protein KH201010_29170 [Edwardsiella ictaluri]BEI10602.1 hypothetical protein STU22726_29330 [Edwardsiella ictaluri]